MADARNQMMTVDPPADGATRSVSVVVPTYQEVESLPAAVKRLDGLRRVGWDLELIVVDDDSRDGTVELIESCPGTGSNWLSEQRTVV